MSQPLVVHAVSHVIGTDTRVVMLNARDVLPTPMEDQPYNYHIDAPSNKSTKSGSAKSEPPIDHGDPEATLSLKAKSFESKQQTHNLPFERIIYLEPTDRACLQAVRGSTHAGKIGV